VASYRHPPPARPPPPPPPCPRPTLADWICVHFAHQSLDSPAVVSHVQFYFVRDVHRPCGRRCAIRECCFKLYPSHHSHASVIDGPLCSCSQEVATARSSHRPRWQLHCVCVVYSGQGTAVYLLSRRQEDAQMKIGRDLKDELTLKASLLVELTSRHGKLKGLAVYRPPEVNTSYRDGKLQEPRLAQSSSSPA
jgi:hypothetical protein